jgi:hypothetical protein
MQCWNASIACEALQPQYLKFSDRTNQGIRWRYSSSLESFDSFGNICIGYEDERALHIRPHKFHKGFHLEGISDIEFLLEIKKQESASLVLSSTFVEHQFPGNQNQAKVSPYPQLNILLAQKHPKH